MRLPDEVFDTIDAIHRRNLSTAGKIIPDSDRRPESETAEAFDYVTATIRANRHVQESVIRLPGTVIRWLGAIGAPNAVDVSIRTATNAVVVITMQVPGWLPYAPCDTGPKVAEGEVAEAIMHLEEAQRLASLPPTILTNSLLLDDLRAVLDLAKSAAVATEDAVHGASRAAIRWNTPPRGQPVRVAGMRISWTGGGASA